MQRIAARVYPELAADTDAASVSSRQSSGTQPRVRRRRGSVVKAWNSSDAPLGALLRFHLLPLAEFEGERLMATDAAGNPVVFDAAGAGSC